MVPNREGFICSHAPFFSTCCFLAWLHAGEGHSPQDCAALTEQHRPLVYIRDPPYVIGRQLTCHVFIQLSRAMGTRDPFEHFSAISRKLSKICQIFIYGPIHMMIDSWSGEKIQPDFSFNPVKKYWPVHVLLHFEFLDDTNGQPGYPNNSNWRLAKRTVPYMTGKAKQLLIDMYGLLEHTWCVKKNSKLINWLSQQVDGLGSSFFFSGHPLQIHFRIFVESIG